MQRTQIRLSRVGVQTEVHTLATKSSANSSRMAAAWWRERAARIAASSSQAVTIGIFPEAPPEVRMRRLFDDGFVTVARTRHPRIGPPSLSMEDFLRETHVLVAPRGDARGTVDDALAALGLRRRVARTFPSFLAAVWHVADSDDLLTVSARLVATVARRLALQQLTPPLRLPTYAMRLAWHPRVDRSPENTWFRALLVEVADALP